MTGKENNSQLGEMSETVKKYMNLRIDEYKLKGVENFSIISNKVLVILIATMLGAVILQLIGFAFAFFIGWLLNSTSLGFAIVALVFGMALWLIYIKRDTLFINRMVQMYMRMFFNNKQQI